jgi:RNA polymerase sigma-70 factor, ECF subfamily
LSSDDHRLVAECLQGRKESFGILVQRHQDRLFNTVFRLLGDAEDAKDALQDAFLQAYRSLDRFKGESQFYTWVYRIAINAAMSLKRRRRVVLSINGNGALADDRHEPLDLRDGSQPGLALENADSERRMQEVLNRLSPDHRTVLVLKDVEGQKYEQIADLMQVPIGTVRSRLHRARLELRELLQNDDHR